MRILFIALAFVLGAGLTAAGVLGVWDVLQVSFIGTIDLDDPPPFRFSSYGYTPAIGIVALLGGLAALKRRWEALALTGWLLTGVLVVGALDAIWNLGRDGMLAAGGLVGMLLVPIIGLILAAAASPHEKRSTDMPLSASRQEKIRLRNTLVVVAALSYLWRVATLAANSGAMPALADLRGTTEMYLVLSSIIAVAAAILLVCAVSFFRRNERVVTAALAFTIGLAFEGFLHTLDLALDLGTRLEVVYSLQDAMAFVACSAALVLSVRSDRVMSRATVR